jgi:hypothetical protein
LSEEESELAESKTKTQGNKQEMQADDKVRDESEMVWQAKITSLPALTVMRRMQGASRHGVGVAERHLAIATIDASRLAVSITSQ